MDKIFNKTGFKYLHELKNTPIATRQALHYCLCGKKTKNTMRVVSFGTENRNDIKEPTDILYKT